MKSSSFNIWVHDQPAGKALLYNSLYGSLTTFDPDEHRLAASLLNRPEKIPDEAQQPFHELLIRQRYLIADTTDERAIIENRKREGIRDNNRLDVIIMPTLDCNFACTYCYESRRQSMMSPGTETAIKKWLQAEVGHHKVLLLHWFGGEPLLGYQRVISITRHAVEVTRAAGSACISHMTTNGYLLNKHSISGLIDAGIYDYQITVDGPADVHDRYRVLRNGGGTFNQVFRNIALLACANERVRISLRVNFNHQNMKCIPSLLEAFPIGIRKQLRVVFEPIFGDNALSATGNLDAAEISAGLSEYYGLASTLGYDVVLGLSAVHLGKLVYCYAERQNQYIFNYNGDVFKCSVCDFQHGDRVGYLRDDGTIVREAAWNDWVSEDLFEPGCYSCPTLPLCMGGCRRMRLEGAGTGSTCALVPTNTSYILKQIAFGNLKEALAGVAARPCAGPNARHCSDLQSLPERG